MSSLFLQFLSGSQAYFVLYAAFLTLYMSKSSFLLGTIIKRYWSFDSLKGTNRETVYKIIGKVIEKKEKVQV